MTETIFVPISEAKANLSELVRQAADANVVLMKHSTAVALLIGAERFEEMIDEILDLKDRLRVYELGGVTIDIGQVRAALGL
jgi:antitoxin StbD